MEASGQLHSPSWEEVPGTHWIGGWVGLTARLDALAYLLTPWCRIFFEKLIVTQLVKQ